MDLGFLPSADELWPRKNDYEGEIPRLELSPVWSILNPKEEDGLKNQLDRMVQKLGSNYPSGVSVDETHGPVYIDERAVLEPGIHIIGPTYIGPEAIIRHGAYVRSYSWICFQAVVGHSSEIKHSILLPKAKAPHFNYVGDSVIGTEANLGAGVKLSNLRNDGGEVHTRYSNRRIPTGLRKFGALIGEKCQLGCNAVLNPGVILGTACSVFPNLTVSGIHPPDEKIS